MDDLFRARPNFEAPLPPDSDTTGEIFRNRAARSGGPLTPNFWGNRRAVAILFAALTLRSSNLSEVLSIGG